MRRTLLATAFMAVVLAACGGGQPDGSAGASGAAAGSATASPSPAGSASQHASAGASSSAGALATPQAGAGDLEGVLPEEVDGIAMRYQSTTGTDLFGPTAPGGAQFFEAVGGDASDVSTAFGIGTDANGQRAVSIVAFRVAGADPEILREQFVRTLQAQQGTAEEATIGGKDVLEVRPAVGESISYVYVSGDVVFVVATEPVELAEDALAALP